MAETRRDLFKMSILSALGLASCAPPSPPPEPPPPPRTSPPSVPTLLRSTQSPPAVPPGGYNFNQAIAAGTMLLIDPDLYVFLVDNPNAVDFSPTDTRSITPGKNLGMAYFMANGKTFQTDVNGKLQSLPTTAGGYYVIQCWNEIGHQ